MVLCRDRAFADVPDARTFDEPTFDEDSRSRRGRQSRPRAIRARSFRSPGTNFTATCSAFAWRLTGAGPFEAIVCITRGGLVPAAIVARELGIKLIETICVSSYAGTNQGDLSVLKSVASSVIGAGQRAGGARALVDDLVDTGKTAKVVREIVPRAHLATVYAKPMGRPLVDTFITEVCSAGYLDLFPLGTGLAFQPPINEAGLWPRRDAGLLGRHSR